MSIIPFTVRALAPGIAALLAAATSVFAAAPAEEFPAGIAKLNAEMAATFRHGSFEIEGGTTLAYHIREGSGPALVLIPGSWGDYLVFNHLVEYLDKDFRIVVVELRGHGDSGPAIVGGTMESFADDVLRVIEHLKLDRYYLGGHSIGGMLAVEFAGREPAGLAGAIPIEGWTHHTVQENAFGAVKDYPLSPEHAAERAANRARGLARLSDEERTDFASIWRKWDGNEALATTHVPVLELWGDRGLDPAPSRAVMQIPDRDNIDVVWIADASHALLVEQPEAVAKAINAFIATVEARRTR